MRRKKTILRMFLVPLIVVMLFQAVVAFGAVYLGGTTRHLNEYSVGIMEQIVKNRNLILANNMTHQWIDLYGEYEKAEDSVDGILRKEGLSLSQFLADEEAKNQFLSQMLDSTLTILRRNGVNGVYLILSDGVEDGREPDAEGEYKCSGIYFRDMDSYVNPSDYSDILMERGDYEFSHGLSIPFDVFWTAKFRFKPEGTRPEDDFFYKPYQAAREHPGTKAENLAFWSKSFCLEGNSEKDSYRMISYSVPLFYKGEVFGVMGIEVSDATLAGLLPSSELNDGEQSGYVIAQSDEAGRLLPFFLSGSAAKRGISLETPLELKDGGYTDFYQVENLGLQQSYYAKAVPFPMYNSNTPFEQNSWVLIGIQSGDSLFGLGHRIERNFILAVACAILFGTVAVWILMLHLVRPISNLAAWIRNVRNNSPGEPGKYRASDIAELRELFDAICDLTERQRKAELLAKEEKERYLLALQSSTDIIYTYDAGEDAIDIYNLSGEENQSSQMTHVEHMMDGLDQNPYLSDSDRQAIRELFLKAEERFELDIRYLTKSNGWQWLALSGKVIYDAGGQKNKVIGSIRNIQEQKEKERMESKAARLDLVTGLYRETVGREMIMAELEQSRPGILMLLDLDKFQDMNEQYGIEFGDAILEEIGHFILERSRECEKTKKSLLGVRAGGDEILLWFRGFERTEVLEFFESLNRMLSRLSSGADISVTASALKVEGDAGDYQQSSQQLQAALFYGKRRHRAKLTFCGEVPAEEYGERRACNEIASSGSLRNFNMVTKAFNLFDRGGQVGPVISVLFAKMGAAYRASDILMTEIQWDFNASALYRQWHAGENYSKEEQIHHFKAGMLENFQDMFREGYVIFDDEKGLDSDWRLIFHIPERAGGICIPMYDNGRLAGTVTLLRGKEYRSWSEEERAEIQEVVKIIETNVNRERYDLASRAKSDFLSRMSHEIRTPMNAIIGMTAIARQKEQSGQQVERCLEKIDQSSQYLLNLINDILDMSKIESGKMKLSYDSGSLEKLVDEIEDLMVPQLEAKHITYNRKISLKNPWVSADMMRVKQVIINLLSNAVKFTPEGGRVTMSLQEREMDGPKTAEGETEVYFAVEDTGIGIDPENQKRIFSAFEQEENYTAASYGGTGLGLSISSRLVRMMGGEIQLDSEKGRGSCFSFRLRLRLTGEKIETEPEKADIVEDFKGYRVLLVEDNELNTEIARTLLEMNGFEVRTAGDGKEGVECFASEEPGSYDLILMDIRMPVMDGLEAAKCIRRMERPDARTIPIIAMTANAFDEDMKKSIESGMNGHLAKPVDVGELLKTIREAVHRKDREK